MRVLDLFSGIGGFSLGLERAGMQTVAFCEVDPKARLVLEKRWPHVPVYGDVRELDRGRLESDGIGRIDVICGGFPCQDISNAGERAGIEGDRSGLWSEYARLTGELRPKYIIVENVAALLGRGLSRVLGDLAKIGYDAEWHCIPAAAIGAPHQRDRIWIIAYPMRSGWGERRPGGSLRQAEQRWPTEEICNANDQGLAQRESITANIESQLQAIERANHRPIGWWSVEPTVGRVADGIPNRVDRLKQLGNAVVPQIPELIGRAIMRQISH